MGPNYDTVLTLMPTLIYRDSHIRYAPHLYRSTGDSYVSSPSTDLPLDLPSRFVTYLVGILHCRCLIVGNFCRCWVFCCLTALLPRTFYATLRLPRSRSISYGTSGTIIVRCRCHQICSRLHMLRICRLRCDHSLFIYPCSLRLLLRSSLRCLCIYVTFLCRFRRPGIRKCRSRCRSHTLRDLCLTSSPYLITFGAGDAYLRYILPSPAGNFDPRWRRCR